MSDSPDPPILDPAARPRVLLSTMVPRAGACNDRFVQTRRTVLIVDDHEGFRSGPRLAETPAQGFIPRGRLSGEALAALVG